MASNIKRSCDFSDGTIRNIMGCQELFYARIKESLPADKHSLLDNMFSALNMFAQDSEEYLTLLRKQNASNNAAPEGWRTVDV